MPKNREMNKFMLLCSSDDNASDDNDNNNNITSYIPLKQNNLNISHKVLKQVKQEVKQVVKQEVKQEDKQEVLEVKEDKQEYKTKYIPPTVRTDRQKPVSMHDIILYDNTITNIGDTMKLQTLWCVWIHENTNEKWDIGSYQSIYEINSIGCLWRFLHVFDNLDKTTRQYYVMRQGILPIWEDNNNKNGGICSIMINNATKYTQTNIGVETFVALCLLILNETFILHNGNINGICYSVKNRNVLIKLWVKNYEINKNFKETMPLILLNKIDSIIHSFSKYRNNTSNISIRYDRIKPE